MKIEICEIPVRRWHRGTRRLWVSVEWPEAWQHFMSVPVAQWPWWYCWLGTVMGFGYRIGLFQPWIEGERDFVLRFPIGRRRPPATWTPTYAAAYLDAFPVRTW